MSGLTLTLEENTTQVQVRTLEDFPVGRQEALKGFFNEQSTGLAHPSDSIAVRSAMFTKHLNKISEDGITTRKNFAAVIIVTHGFIQSRFFIKKKPLLKQERSICLSNT